MQLAPRPVAEPLPAVGPYPLVSEYPVTNLEAQSAQRVRIQEAEAALVRRRQVGPL